MSTPEYEEGTFRALTDAMRKADRWHEETGGGTRHYLRDCFLPALAEAGLSIVATASPSPSEPDAAKLASLIANVESEPDGEPEYLKSGEWKRASLTTDDDGRRRVLHEWKCSRCDARKWATMTGPEAPCDRCLAPPPSEPDAREFCGCEVYPPGHETGMVVCWKCGLTVATVSGIGGDTTAATLIERASRPDALGHVWNLDDEPASCTRCRCQHGMYASRAKCSESPTPPSEPTARQMLDDATCWASAATQ